jgi:AcrR family transcriptional regulator
MGTLERKEKERIIRRNDVIDAAETLFMEKGFEQTTMDEIAKSAGFTKKTIYTYISSKDEIYMEIMLRGFQLLNKLIDEALALQRYESCIDDIKLLGLTFASFSMKHNYYFRAITNYENKALDFDQSNQGNQRTLIESCYTAGQYSMHYLETFIRNGIEKKEIINTLDPKIVALFLWSSMTGLINIVGRKEKYVIAYFNDNTDLILEEGLNLILNSIINKK